jgi:methionine biosynthesis protein MetW
MMNRLDLNAVNNWVPRESRVLDLGCGDGAFLQRLCDERGVVGVGVEIDADNLISAVKKGLNVIQEDINDGLHCFPAHRFDVVLLTHALQELTHPHVALERMVQIGKQAIVSFPNFGHWFCRLHLGFRGRMPMSRAMPHHWYDTPNIHFCTVRDFEALCSELNIDIIERATVSGPGQKILGKLWPNVFATSAVYRIRRSGQ